jgi:hypothetical protein
MQGLSHSNCGVRISLFSGVCTVFSFLYTAQFFFYFSFLQIIISSSPLVVSSDGVGSDGVRSERVRSDGLSVQKVQGQIGSGQLELVRIYSLGCSRVGWVVRLVTDYIR